MTTDARTHDLLDEQWMSEQEVAEVLGCSLSAVRSWRRRGVGPKFHRLGPRLLRYRRIDVATWLAESEQE